MEYFGVQQIKTEQNEATLNFRGVKPIQYDLISEQRKLDRVSENSFFEHIECYFRNRKCDLVKGAAFCKKPTITIHRRLIDNLFKISWVTISESLVQTVSWSVQSLNIFMLNHGLPAPIVSLMKEVQKKEIEILSRSDIEETGEIVQELNIEAMGITKGNYRVTYNSQQSQSRFQIDTFTSQFSTCMQHPRLSKEKRKEIKKVFQN